MPNTIAKIRRRQDNSGSIYCIYSCRNAERGTSAFFFCAKQSTPRAAFSSRIGFPLTCYEPKTRVRQHLTLHSWKRSLPLLATTLRNKLRFSPFPAIGLVSLLLVEVLRWIENGQFIKTQTKRSTIIFFVHSVHFGNHSAQRNDLTGAGFAFQRFNC